MRLKPLKRSKFIEKVIQFPSSDLTHETLGYVEIPIFSIFGCLLYLKRSDTGGAVANIFPQKRPKKFIKIGGRTFFRNCEMAPLLSPQFFIQ